MSRIGIVDLSVAYNGRRVVDGVSMHIEPRTWVALIGPNGAGKSSLLRAVASLVPFAGQIDIGGVPAAEMTRRQLSELVAFLPQRPVMPEGVTVADYVAIGRTPYIPYWGTEGLHDREIIAGVLERLELTTLSERHLDTLSGGEAQRVVLARALTQQSEILLLDEPTSALDVGHQQQVLELIDELRSEQGLTVLSALHDLTLAGQYADRLVMMRDGVVVSDGVAKSVLTEESIMMNYDARVRVVDMGATGLIVTPLRPERGS
ncbi:MAG TPA: ABC transporter ATP-binding protein [Acidimicrobiia bacterium]|nr:ABC transporter ATP-binding protein [Acidimicrobiia bacterium]